MEENNQLADDRLVAAEENPEENLLDRALRPEILADFIGQNNIKQNLEVALTAAKKRGDVLEHIMLYGNPGLGKTTLAHIIAREMGSNIKIIAGPTLEKVGDLAAILSNLQTGDILFIDEIHRLNKTIAEVLYPALEDFVLDIVIGQGPAARTIRMPIAPFTLIGATTKISMLPGPLRDRFGHVYHLNFYEPTEIETIVNRSARLLQIPIDPESIRLISTRARRTPRIANRLLKRVRDYAEVHTNAVIDEQAANGALNMLAIDELGLDEIDRQLLNTLIEKFNGGPTGLNTLAAAIAEEMDTIETVYEPYLLQLGFLERTPRGRKASPAAYKHLNHTPPPNQTGANF